MESKALGSPGSCRTFSDQGCSLRDKNQMWVISIELLLLLLGCSLTLDLHLPVRDYFYSNSSHHQYRPSDFSIERSKTADDQILVILQ
jgi:hypothetical protein